MPGTRTTVSTGCFALRSGAMEAGTTALWRRLARQLAIAPSRVKEPRLLCVQSPLPQVDAQARWAWTLANGSSSGE